MAKQQRNRTTFKTDRLEVIRFDIGEYWLYVDSEPHSFHKSQDEAEHTGAMILEEQARDIAAGLVGQTGVLV